MELSALKFAADTTELERASKVIAGLVTDVAKLDKASRDAAQTEAILAKAAKSNADANLQNAKAQDVRLKSTIAADKADKSNEQAVVKKTKAIDKETEATAKNVGVLQKQKDILEFQTQGYSKGQAGILAYGKAAGLATSDIAELGKVLETQRKLMGVDPFDKSLSGIKSLQNQYTELKESLRQYNTDSELTAKQTRELARDKERLIEKMKVEGASFADVRKAVRAHNDEYVSLAGQYNKLSSAEDAVVKGRKEAVAATNYLTQADQKLAAALNTSNAAIDKAGTDSLVKYENALRKSGVSQDVATSRLGAYKAQLVQVQALEEKRRSQHLARALTPQISDVVVSLWSGQSPFTVLLQQGAQVNDLFQLSGVAAEDFGKTVKQAFTSMIPAIMTVVKGVGGLIVDGFMAAGNAVVNFVGKVTGMNTVLEMGSNKLKALGFEGLATSVKGFGAVMASVAAVGVLALVTALASLGIAFKNALKEGAELSRNLELTGASLALTKSAAVDLAQSLATSERPVAKSVELINELAKAGKFSSENIKLVNDAAIDLERYGKVAIADTAKELSKLREDPVKALIEVAEKTGYVNLETIETVKSLREQGKMAEAAEVAMKAWATSSTSAATSIKNQMSPLEQVWDSMLSKINQVIGRLQDLARGSGLAEQIADKEAQLASVKGGFFTSTFGLSPKGAKDVNRLSEEIYMLKLQLQAETDITKERAKRSSAAAQLKAETEATKEYTAAIEKQAGKEVTLSEFVKKAVVERTKLVASALSKNVEDVKLSADALDKITKGAELQWKEMQKKPKKDPSENYYATLMREATNNTIAATNAAEELTKSELKLLEVKADPRFASLNALQKQDIANKYEAAIAAEKQAKAVDDVGKAEAFRDKILGKSEGITREYYGQIKALEEHAVKAGWSREQIEELTRAIFQGTPAWQQYQRALDDVKRSADKFNEMSIGSQAESAQYNKELNYRVDMLGKTSEQQKAITIEYQRANKLREVDIKLNKQLKDINDEINKAKLKGLKPEDYKSLTDAQVQAERDAGEERKLINREVAVQAAEDFDAEFRKIKSGVTDSIVTALFEGGKAGSKKLRDVLVSVLRQKVTMVVDVGVNAFMNSLIGGALGGGGAGAAGGTGGAMSMLSNGFSLYNAGSQALTLGSQYLSGTMSGSNVLGSVFANATGTGIDGLLATNGAFGTAPGAAGGAGGAGMAGAGAFAAVAAVVLNALGAFKSERKVAGGLSGTLGKGNINAWEEWREGGTLFSGPEYNTISPTEELDKAREKLAKARESGDLRNVALQEMLVNNLEDNYRGLAEATMKQSKVIQDSYEAMRTSAAKMADTLGIASANVKTFTTQLGGEKGINFEGLNAEQQQAKLAEALANANNELAMQLIGTWEKTFTTVTKVVATAFGQGEEAGIAQSFEEVVSVIEGAKYTNSVYAKEGEKAIDTLTRLSISLSNVNAVFDTLGYTMYSASLAGGDMASKLVDLFGSLGTFNASTTSYYENYYSEAEKQATLIRQLTTAFGEYNLALPSTRDAFRQVVESQNLTTEAGREMFKNLMGLQNPLNELFKTFENLENSVVELSNTVLDEVRRLRGLTDSTSSVGGIAKLEQQFLQTANKAKGGDLSAFEDLAKQSQVLDKSYLSSAGTAAEYELRKAMLVKTLLETDGALRSGTTSAYTPSTLIPAQGLTSPTSTASVASQQTAAGTNLIVLELQALRGDVDLLRAEVRADATHNAKTAKILERVTPDGNSLQVSQAT